jgi:hypothetical protein
MRLRHDTTALIVERLSGGTWRRAATIGHDDTLGGAVATDNLAAAAEAVLHNVEIYGSLTGWSPFWIAGKVLGSQTKPTAVACKGRTDGIQRREARRSGGPIHHHV